MAVGCWGGKEINDVRIRSHSFTEPVLLKYITQVFFPVRWERITRLGWNLIFPFLHHEKLEGAGVGFSLPQVSFPDSSVGKKLPAMQETTVQFLGWENPLEKGMTTHSSILGLPLWLSW